MASVEMIRSSRCAAEHGSQLLQTNADAEVDERARPTVLVLAQAYVPDPAAAGQHMADVAAEMVRRGWRVLVYAGARGYDDPTVVYKRREVIDGVEIVRFPLSSFGKGSIAIRLLAQALLLAQAALRALFVSNLRCVIVTTSPPLAAAGGWFVSKIRRVPLKYWVMDLNPDQVVRMGVLRERSLPVRVFEFLNGLVLRRATDVVVLDRMMAKLVNDKVDVSEKLAVIPPWPHEERLHPVAQRENAFRKLHGLDGKFVVMYSGNHSPANPLATLLAAAARLRNDPRFVFVFIGGGGGKKDVEEAIARGATNLRSIPYQPLEDLAQSLSAADVHVVSIGDELIGVIHPCKVYGAMAVARPVLTFGPAGCHLHELVERFSMGVHVPHGDVDRAVAALEWLVGMPASDLAAMGERGRWGVQRELSQGALRGRFCDIMERGVDTSALARAGASTGFRGFVSRRSAPYPGSAPTVELAVARSATSSRAPLTLSRAYRADAPPPAVKGGGAARSRLA